MDDKTPLIQINIFGSENYNIMKMLLYFIIIFKVNRLELDNFLMFHFLTCRSQGHRRDARKGC